MTAPRPSTRCGVAYRRLLLRLAARDLSADLQLDDAAAELADLAAGDARGGAALARSRGRRVRRRRQARRHRAWASAAGTSSTTSAMSTSIFVAEPVDGADEAKALRAAPARRRDDAGLLRAHRGRHALAGRRGAAPGGQGRTAGAHARQPRRATTERWAKTWEFQALLKARPVAGDLDAGRGATSRSVTPWSGRPPTATDFVERRAGDASPRRRPASRRGGGPRRSSSGRAGCATSSSPCSCSSSCMAAPTRRCAARHTLRRTRSTRRGRLRRPRRRGAARRTPTGSCAPSSTGSSCSSCAVPTCCRPTEDGAARRSARSHGADRRPGRDLDDGVRRARPRGPPDAREALLPTAAQRGRRGCRQRGAPHHRGRRADGSRRSASPTRPRRCGTSRR